MNRILLIVALLAWGIMSHAAADKKKKGKAAQPTVQVDTVPNAIFSYAYGLLNTQGLKGFLVQRMNVDTTQVEAFVRGFDSGHKSDNFLEALKAYVAGAEIRRQVEMDVCRQIDRQLTESDTTAVIDKESFISGFRDGITAQGGLNFTEAAMLVDKNTKYYTDLVTEKKYGDWRRQNQEWLADNARKDSVKTTASGLQYKVLVMGQGEKPGATDRVKVHYEGTLVDGTVFDSSYKRNQPATFGCNQVIKGWSEALQMMPVGSKWQLFIPYDLAYGDREQGKIKPFSALVFTVELLSVEK